jgi:hypothetical protein
VMVVQDGTTYCMIQDGLARWRRGGKKHWNAGARWVELSAP